MIAVMSHLDKDGAERQALERLGCKEGAVPISYEGKAVSVWTEENLNTACDLLGTCRWVIPWGYTYKLEMPAKLFTLASGHETSEDDLLWTARRVLTLERIFRVNRGIRRDSLPKRLFEAAVPDGKYKGEKLDREKFEQMLDDYYDLRGWNKEGVPTEETLKKFDLLPGNVSRSGMSKSRSTN
jgi:aldehyde:ferredoxin oxidoreductase